MTCCQIGDVNRPLMSVSQVVDAGNTVTFDSDGGWIYNKNDGSFTRFERHSNIYELDLWLKSSDANGNPKDGSQSGFAWQGL